MYVDAPYIYGQKEKGKEPNRSKEHMSTELKLRTPQYVFFLLYKGNV